MTSQSAPGDPDELSEESNEANDLARSLLQLVAVPANAEVVDAALGLIVALAHATVEGADGVSVTLSRHGTLATVAASDETISGMDADQYATGQGPCVSAATDGHRIHVDSLDAEFRWPEFIPRAKQRGINSILSMPLLTGDRALGALNIYSTVAGAFADREQALAGLCAQQASDLLARTATDVSPGELGDRVRAALEVRQVITLAVGVIMTREGLSADDAHARLLQSSLQNALPLRDQAHAIVASTQRGAPPAPTEGGGPHGRTG
jgi:GAF domain-containing protein